MPEPYSDNCPIGYVTNFCVTPSQRNMGAGSALLEALQQYCRGVGFDALIVWPAKRGSPLWRRSGVQPPQELLETSTRDLKRFTSDTRPKAVCRELLVPSADRPRNSLSIRR
ncbi:GNAT family N-acetyltransferase [Streptomyces decoyicus]|uniref:GNAT family N-acetyltransferase n=1 Tax=Streptomyces decoyicus TaxID=249567 RepID=UPI00380518B7